MIIDAHHHFWRYDPAEYDWISEPMRVLRRDFLPPDLRAEIAATGVGGVISVQARQTLGETRALLAHAQAHDFIRAVVGWVPLVDPAVRDALAEFTQDPNFRACRHVLQDEPDDDYMLRQDFNRGMRALTEAGLAYDILVFERHLPQSLQLVDRHPHQVFVLDHIGKPRIRDASFAAWHAAIRELARRANVYCKISGLVTEADWRRWSAADLAPYMDAVLDAFGPRRLMYGSDWPVCLLGASYTRWFELVAGFAAHLSVGERDRLLGGTAVDAYQLQPRRPLQ
ncbi:MAG: amidohydrolase family protein [Bryobacterales bacterium]|nr:amidohydrolase family protein [Bryobacterales bacterium]